jgi:RHS repeat-associated protein
MGGGLFSARSYAPFGESYAETGTTDRSFTGQTQDTVPGTTALYDFLYRQQSAAQGRWLVPDPAGLAAVDLTNPQTWNRYAYVANNPLSNVDALGLCGSSATTWDPSTNTTVL